MHNRKNNQKNSNEYDFESGKPLSKNRYDDMMQEDLQDKTDKHLNISE